MLLEHNAMEADRDRLVEQVVKLREALDTAVNYNFSSDFRRAALALLKETEPGDD